MSDEKTFQERREELGRIIDEFVGTGLVRILDMSKAQWVFDMADEIRRLREKESFPCLRNEVHSVFSDLRAENDQFKAENERLKKMTLTLPERCEIEREIKQLKAENERLKEQIPSSTDYSWPELLPTVEERRWYTRGFEVGKKLGRDEAGEEIEQIKERERSMFSDLSFKIRDLQNENEDLGAKVIGLESKKEGSE